MMPTAKPSRWLGWSRYLAMLSFSMLASCGARTAAVVDDAGVLCPPLGYLAMMARIDSFEVTCADASRGDLAFQATVWRNSTVPVTVVPVAVDVRDESGEVLGSFLVNGASVEPGTFPEITSVAGSYTGDPCDVCERATVLFWIRFDVSDAFGGTALACGAASVPCHW